jgi:hypothetical protein
MTAVSNANRTDPRKTLNEQWARKKSPCLNRVPSTLIQSHLWDQGQVFIGDFAFTHSKDSLNICTSTPTRAIFGPAKMSRISPTQFAQASRKQLAMAGAEWLKRCDELAEQQPLLFPELVCFIRDGVPQKIGKSFIDYLSVLQFVASTISSSISTPVLLPEYQVSVKRTMQLFHAVTTDDRPHFERMIKAWLDGVVGESEPVIWAGCIETLNKSEVFAQPLLKEIVVTMTSIADVYAKRLQQSAK